MLVFPYFFTESIFTFCTLSFTLSAKSLALSFASFTASEIYLLTTSTLPSALVISIVTCVTTAATTTNANIGGIIIAITPAAIPAFTGTSTIFFPSLLTFILVTFPLFIKSFNQIFNSSIVSIVFLKILLPLKHLH